MLQQLRLSQQLAVSFGVMISLLVLLSLFSYFTISSGHSNFVDYRQLARTSNSVAVLQADLLSIRIAAIKYFKEQLPEHVKEFNERSANLGEQMQQAKQQLLEPELLALLSTAESQFVQYQDAFKRVIALYEKRHHIVTNTIDMVSMEVQQQAKTLRNAAYQANDTKLLYETAKLQEDLLLAQLYTARFLLTNAQSDFDKAKHEIQLVKGEVNLLLGFTNSEADNAALQSISQAMLQYTQAIDDVQATINQRNELINTKLNGLGPQIAEELEQIKLALKNTQDALGPQLQKQSEEAVTWIVLIAFAVTAFGVFLSWFNVRLIKAPIGGEPKEIAEVAERIAAGDLTIQFDNMQQHTGVYAAIIKMTNTLRDIIATLQTSVNNISASSEVLSSITAQAKSGAENQMEQLTHTAVAMDEMSSTVAEITRSAQLAADSASDADKHTARGHDQVVQTKQSMDMLVGSIQQVSTTISSLANETQSVGSILDVIRAIADQTNLLALNAAIEAARAGEQGRGFAVVADEVRNLASRTQNSTEEIQAMISKLQQEAQRAVTAMADNVSGAAVTAEKTELTGKALEAIAGSVGTIRDMNVQIASASEEQNTVTAQMSQSVRQISDSATETARGAEHAEQEAVKLLALASDLRAITAQFRV
ncbi:methyl-accepting chemotaxis protein [Pseudoalteromonas fenneropenaei]|uniref:Methyl-accepting chemotaxis protein n=1 Tax=Pseudoalteromonas fenneropenaei TaxID=1737459 RepID=A0ABV7CGL3_9GAMM